MSTIHIVEDGEHLPGIAARFGFSDFRTIFDHPENAEFKKKRNNPNVLFPGDQIFIPDREAREETGATEQKHRFEAAFDGLEVQVKVINLSDKPLAGPCDLVAGLNRSPMAEKDHIFKAAIDTDLKKAAMEFTATPPEKKSEAKFRLVVGGLHDIKELSGQQQRLNNLGYFAGFSEKSAAQFKWAVEEFQADHLQEIGIPKPTGVCDTKTQQILEKTHGV